ncbi:MAG: hypothetical protein HY335_05030 [Deinococcus sp.]|nr:hypothetical protein [Deinococcus sp.]
MKGLNGRLILGTVAGLLLLGQTLAATNATNNVTVTIPSVSEIRLTQNSSNAAVANPAITFAPTAAQIISAAEAPINIDPTATPGFNRVSYLVNRNVNWSVAVKASGNPSFPAGLSLGDVLLLYSSNDGDGNPAGGSSLNMSTSDQTVDSGNEKTNSFQHTSLGYQLRLTGDEAEGSSSGVVIQFTLTTP